MKYSVIAPLFDEEDNVEPLVTKLIQVMEKVGEEYELLMVDDGSTDATLGRLIDLLPTTPRLRVISFTENRGQTVGLQAGFDYSTGERIITIDGDLEKDPEYILEMIKKLESKNLDLVYFQKIYQQDVPFMRRAASKIANLFRKAVIGDQAVDVGSTFIVFRANYLKGRNLSSGLHRFFIGLMESEGKSIGYVNGPVYNRAHGQTKYTSWGRLKQGLLDMFYFYLYRNRKTALPKIVMGVSAVALLTFIFPVGLFIKTVIGALAIIATGALLTFMIHTNHLLVLQKRLPYQIKGVWPGKDGKKDNVT